nr:RNA-binding motif protein 4 [Euglena gracilis]|eukprot:EG_transcript_6358
MEDCASIFIGSLPPDITAEALEALCRAFGEVARVDLKRGYAFVDFADPSSAPQALVLNGRVIGQRAIAVRLNTDDNKKKRPRLEGLMPTIAAMSSAAAATCQSVFVGGIPPGFTEEQVQELFESYGPITKLEVKKGYGFVDYSDPTAAVAACCLDGFEVSPGVKLGVRLNLPEHKKGKADAIGAPLSLLKKSRPETATCTSVFVGALPPEATEAQVTALFASVGGVAAVHLKKGFGFVEFASPAAAQAACALDGTIVGSKAIAVRLNLPEHKTKSAVTVPAPLLPAVPVAAAGDCKSVFVGGLPPDAKETDLQHLFAFCGPMERLSMKKSYAFIDFLSPVSAQAACALDGYMFQGKPIGIRINTPENRAAFTAARDSGGPSSGAPSYTSSVASTLGQTGSSAGYSVFSTSPFISGTPTTVFVGGLPAEATSVRVQQLFAAFGTITDVRMKKGYAFVDFSSGADAMRACSLDGLELVGGRRLGVRINKGAETSPGR